MKGLFTALLIVALTVFTFSSVAKAGSLYLYVYDTAGQEVSFNRFKGKPTIVFVYKKNCAICLGMLRELDTLKSAAGAEFNIVPVMVENANTSDARRLFIRLDIRTLPIYLDKDDVLMTNLGFHVTPMTILLNADGKVTKKVVGKMNWTGPFFAEELQELKTGVNINAENKIKGEENVANYE